MEGLYAIIRDIISIALPSLVALYVWVFKRGVEEKEKIREKKQELETNSYKQNTGIIYRYINKLLIDLNCDRVEIIQPHPTGERKWLSVSYAVTAVGVKDSSDMFQNVEMRDVASFVGDISTRQFIYWKDIHEIKDAKIRSHCLLSGNEMVIIYRLEDIDEKWVGNLLVSYLDNKRMSIDHIKVRMQEAGEAIQYILPDYKPYNHG